MPPSTPRCSSTPCGLLLGRSCGGEEKARALFTFVYFSLLPPPLLPPPLLPLRLYPLPLPLRFYPSAFTAALLPLRFYPSPCLTTPHAFISFSNCRKIIRARFLHILYLNAASTRRFRMPLPQTASARRSCPHTLLLHTLHFCALLLRMLLPHAAFARRFHALLTRTASSQYFRFYTPLPRIASAHCFRTLLPHTASAHCFRALLPRIASARCFHALLPRVAFAYRRLHMPPSYAAFICRLYTLRAICRICAYVLHSMLHKCAMYTHLCYIDK